MEFVSENLELGNVVRFRPGDQPINRREESEMLFSHGLDADGFIREKQEQVLEKAAFLLVSEVELFDDNQPLRDNMPPISSRAYRPPRQLTSTELDDKIYRGRE